MSTNLNGIKGRTMKGLMHSWRASVAGGLLGLLAAGSASSHVASVERALQAKAFRDTPSAMRGSERRVRLRDGSQLSLNPEGTALTRSGDGKPPRAYALAQARLNASLTLLPSGRVLVWGGTDAAGQLQRGGLWFHPDSARLDPTDEPTPSARSGHTATVLADGRVLFAGGLEQRPAELWDERSNRAVALAAGQVVPRLGHRAELDSDGGVRIFGGHALGDGSVATDLSFDPQGGTFASGARRSPSARADIARSWPAQGASEVAPDTRLAVLFADELRMADLNEANVSLVGPGGATRVRVAPVEDGRLLFVEPAQALFPASRYTLMVEKTHALGGRALPLIAIDFTTAALDAQGRPLPIPADPVGADNDRRVTGAGERCHQGDALLPCRAHGTVEDAVWSPGRDNTGNRWRLYGKSIEADANKRIAHLARLYGLTMVRGRIVRIDQTPVEGVEVSIGRTRARTDTDGRFNLFDVAAGAQELYVDGSTASRGSEEYGQFVVGVQVKAGQSNELPYLMHLPKIAARDKIRIASPLQKDLVVGHPDIPGLELHIPKGTVIHDRKGRLVTELAIVPTPVNRAPFPVMENHPMAFTVEPGAAQIRGLDAKTNNGIRVYYPNYDGYGTGTEANFWIYDPTEGWRVYGKGTVSADGRHVVPEAGVALHQTMGGMYSVPGSNGATESYAADQNGDCGCGSEAGDGGAASAGDPIDLKTGEFLYAETDIRISDIVPLTIERNYRPNDLQKREFGIGTSWNWGYTLNRPGTSYDVLELIQPNGTAVRFDRISGTGNQGEWRQAGSTTQFAGATLRTVYDSDPTQPWGRAFRLRLHDGSQLQFSSWNDIRLRWIEDRFGNRTSLVYSAGLVTTIVSPSGRRVSIDYDGNNRIEKISDHTGRAWQYGYNAKGLLADVIYPDTKAKHYAYRVAGTSSVTQHRVESITDRRGLRLLFNEFEQVGGGSAGRVIRQTQADGGIIQIDYAHVVDGVAGTLITDPDGVKRRVVFDANSPYPKSETLGYGTPQAQIHTYERNSHGQLAASVDPLGRRTEFEYDGNGQLSKATSLVGSANAASAFMAYHPDGSLASVTDPLARTTKFDYTAGCLTRITSALNKSVSYVCNGAGQPVSVTDSAGRTSILEYDGYDLVKVTDAAGRTVELRYDALGRKVAMRDDAGNVVRTKYNVFDEIVEVADAVGNAIQNEYDDNGNLLAVLLPNGNGVTYTYDARNRVETRTDSLSQVESWTYYKSDRVKTYTDRKGQVTQYRYDGVGREDLATYHDGSTVGATYDAADRLRALADSSSGSLTFDFDDLDQLSQTTSAQGTVTYAYDTAGRRSEMTAASQAKVEYHYDTGDRLRRIVQGAEQVEFDYDALGRQKETVLPNGVKAAYSYNDVDQLTQIAWQKPGVPALGDLTYDYDATGRLISQAGSFASQSLPGATATPNVFDDNNRLSVRGVQSETYDANGNLIGAGARTYVWNARDQLVRILQGGSAIAEFSYDALGRRTGRTEASTTTTYLYDGSDAVQEVEGGTVNPILTGLEVDQRFARNDAGGRTYFLADHLGSTRALTNAAGAVVQRYDYTPYGEESHTAAGFSNPYTYTGREQDRSGLLYYRARYYQPETARFISEDTLGFASGENNFYAYAKGAPLSYTDPSGHFAQLIVAALVGAGIDLALQLATNGGRLSCVNWGQVGIGAALGAVTLVGGRLLIAGLRGLKTAKAVRNVTRVRHYTDRAGLRGIQRSQSIRASRVKIVGEGKRVEGVHVEVGKGRGFGSARTGAKETGAGVDAKRPGGYVEFDAPKGLDMYSTPGIGPRATAVIDSMGKDLSLVGTNPVFVRVWSLW
ncbi:RHS repeat-associated core domain-containing protein [Lysobacter enzymogenes]|uniref:RHS repeat-associated core domain-containing protein n=1 Tax=Lysobacter enzymogenes TaxID=69 RepID=UPI00089ADF19|nr:RHS repeat-associated core domain-containing protein [Lysobacter enzymogenes]SDW99873.1 RHS repeat-associated core domain-containing protein [Lysobacter enzymogenes]